MELDFVTRLVKGADSKIVLLVLDGLGGTPDDGHRLTELEAAATPNLDELAAASICGLHLPIAQGITPGSGPAHLSLFGYDPVAYQVGRGVLAALGTNFDLQPEDVAARGNFCTIDETGRVTDRRAGRIATEVNLELCRLLSEIELPGVELFVRTVKEHRFLFVLRGNNLRSEISDTDPQVTGREPLPPKPKQDAASATAQLVARFLEQAKSKLAAKKPANMVLLRGFSMRPSWPTFSDCFGLKAAAIAQYPMYRGVAKLVGMEILDGGEALSDEVAALRRHWRDFDFFYVHVKKIDSAGEDGDFERKRSIIEEVDKIIPEIRDLRPDVLIVTGDHSTPSALASHSWHPVPVLLHSKVCRPDAVLKFGESECLRGALGPCLPATTLMPLALANALRLDKFGA